MTVLIWYAKHRRHWGRKYNSTKVNRPSLLWVDKIFFVLPIVCTFSATSCAVIILNGAPSSAPTSYFFRWRITLFCYIDVPQRAHCFLPHRVQLLFWMVPHRAHLFTFYSKVGIPHFSAIKISSSIVYTFFCPIVCSYYFEWCPIECTYQLLLQIEDYPILLHWRAPTSALFSAPSCAVIILNVAPSSAPICFIFRWSITLVCYME